MLLGGLPLGAQAEARCEAFWKHFSKVQPDHEIYTQLGKESWKRCIPVCVHGDKGRTLKKSPIMCVSFESAFGLPPEKRQTSKQRANAKKDPVDGNLNLSCEARLNLCTPPETLQCFSADAKLLGQCMVKQRFDDPSTLAAEPSSQLHNSKGHSFLSRFLLYNITHAVFKTNSDTINAALREVSQGLYDLFWNGIHLHPKDTPWRAVLIGVKGDAEFHVESGGFERSYLNVGTVSERAMCAECLAGTPNFEFEDFQDCPRWASTLGASPPTEGAPFDVAPFSQQFPVSKHRHDLFHVVKYGVARDLCASMIITLGHLGYFDDESDPAESKAIPARLERAHSRFKLWACAEGKSPLIRHFQKANFHYLRTTTYPWINAKGADITLILMFLQFWLPFCQRDLKNPSHATPLQAMVQTVGGTLDVIGISHSHHLWLRRGCAALIYQSGMKCLRGFSWLARFALSQGLCCFAMRPKAHSLHHLLFDIKRQLDQPDATYILSPACWLCENNEDWIGRVSRLSRRVSGRTTSLRTTQRYLIHVKALLRRACSGPDR